MGMGRCAGDTFEITEFHGKILHRIGGRKTGIVWRDYLYYCDTKCNLLGYKII